MKIGFILEEVQMPPLLLCSVICWSKSAADWAGKGCSTLKVNDDVEPVGLYGKLDLSNFPRGHNAESHPKKSFRLHDSVKPPGNELMPDYTITHSP